MLTDKEKLAYILSELKRITLVDEQSNPKKYWEEIEALCSNSTDVMCDNDIFIKDLIKFIEE